MKWLVDANVLFAALYSEHTHNKVARAWLNRAKRDGWGIAVETYLTVVRLQMIPAIMNQHPSDVNEAQGALDGELDGPHPATVLSGERPTPAYLGRAQGSKQVNDLYLVQLAASHGAKLATFDEGIVAEWPDHAVLAG